MDAAAITMDKEEAQVHYREYLDATKVRKEKYVEELKNLYRYLANGARVIDIYKAFNQSGVNGDGEPMLAIAPASVKEIHFNKESLGGGHFSKGRWADRETVALPSGTFPNWTVFGATEVKNKGMDEFQIGNIKRVEITAKVPLIPAVALPESKSLDGYYILFEVEKWSAIPVAKDPYLLKKINANAFVVLAEWDISDVELAVMRG